MCQLLLEVGRRHTTDDNSGRCEALSVIWCSPAITRAAACRHCVYLKVYKVTCMPCAIFYASCPHTAPAAIINSSIKVFFHCCSCLLAYGNGSCFVRCRRTIVPVAMQPRTEAQQLLLVLAVPLARAPRQHLCRFTTLWHPLMWTR